MKSLIKYHKISVFNVLKTLLSAAKSDKVCFAKPEVKRNQQLCLIKSNLINLNDLINKQLNLKKKHEKKNLIDTQLASIQNSGNLSISSQVC